MRKFSTIAVGLALLTAGVVLATATEQGPQNTASSLAGRTTAIRLVMAEQIAARAALEEEYRNAPDERTALDVQRRMEDLARTTEWRILGIQAEYLRAAGRVDEAKALEESVQRMQEPRPRRAPIARSRPDASGSAR